ncbi:hypothetical protein ACFWI0_30075, partial [[Kitasatospora] papulosa]
MSSTEPALPVGEEITCGHGGGTRGDDEREAGVAVGGPPGGGPGPPGRGAPGGGVRHPGARVWAAKDDTDWIDDVPHVRVAGLGHG